MDEKFLSSSRVDADPITVAGGAKTPASQHNNTGAEMGKSASERQRRGRWFP